MQTRCQLHFGGMIGDGGRRADRGITECRRRERPSQLFCLLSYAARPSGIMGNAAREDLSTCICRRGLITRLLFPLFEGFFTMSEVCRRWFCVKSLVLSRHADCFKFGKLISFHTVAVMKNRYRSQYSFFSSLEYVSSIIVLHISQRQTGLFGGFRISAGI